MTRETETACVPVSDGHWLGSGSGSEVRGTCRPLQVNCGMHPEGMPDEEGEGWQSHHM